MDSTSSGKRVKTIIRYKILINGIVQGVGFRPFIYNLARSYNLTGFVINTATGVEIQAEGNNKVVSSFIDAIQQKAPPLAVILNQRNSEIPLIGEIVFTIRSSKKTESVATFISPDIATCDDCIDDFTDPANRRYGYPFTNCTNCGPRYTIIEDIPYDRPKTSMRDFTLCNECQDEYDDPTNRRFHAQPNACSVCGPQVELWQNSNTKIDCDNSIAETLRLLKDGKIVAIKGLGGFHLAVDATNNDAVLELRRRKHREEKPLAIMVKDIETAGQFAKITENEGALLKSPRRPIVLLKSHTDSSIAVDVAPDNDRIGIMLPYTPLHHLIFERNIKALVMTSANLSEEPICKDNNESFDRLGDITDAFLIHDRDIFIRNDDSVSIFLADKPRLMRRSRGFAPQPILVDSSGPPVLAVGGMLKNTVCLLKDQAALISQHIGDLENLESYEVFQQTINHLQNVFEIKPELIVHDLHPGYLSTQWAQEQKIQTLAVQHHWAHLATCMAENHVSAPTIGITMDGTGYGTDGTIWGGEILVGDFNGFERKAHFEPVPLPGGDSAIKAPWRTAVSYARHTFGEDLPDLPVFIHQDVAPILEMLKADVNCPLTSSCGRLFDAVAALCGGKPTIRYEGQAAIEFMQAAVNYLPRPFNYVIDGQDDSIIWRIAPIIRSVVTAINQGISVAELSGRFHSTLINLFTDTTKQIRSETGIDIVALSGGVFQNQILFEGLHKKLRNSGFRVLTHSQVPTNDGGISLGQAMIGRAYMAMN